MFCESEPMDTRTHWEKIYQEKDPVTGLSWYQPEPAVSLRLIRAAGLPKDEPIIDVGGGASLLVDCLVDAGYRNIAVLDISGAAIAHAQSRLGAHARAVSWIQSDVASFKPPHPFRLWHDRALFHFLVTPSARRRYVHTLKGTLLPGGHLIIATFAKDGPERCSGLEVMRHDADSLQADLGPEFQLIERFPETHRTPWGGGQNFTWFHLRRKPKASSLAIQEQGK